MKKDKLTQMVMTALFVAFTAVATMIIKIPTPTQGYVHVGDALVLLCGVLLGPGLGAIAAGLGSAFADAFSGYMMWVPGTFLIKAATAAVAGVLYRTLNKKHGKVVSVIAAGALAEAVMVAGYFVYGTLLLVLSGSGVAAALTEEFFGIPFNIMQGVCGIAIAAAILPVLSHGMAALSDKEMRKNSGSKQ